MTRTHQPPLGSNSNLVKLHNLRTVLFHLLNNEPAYRVDIAAEAALSTTTITNLIDELISLGLVVEQGVEETNAPRKIGRPRSALYLVKNARFAIGVQIGVGFFRIGLVNLKAEILQYQTFPFSPGAAPEAVIQEIILNVKELIARRGLETQRILGVGVGMPGLVSYQSGANIRAHQLRWENAPIRDWLSQGLDLPVLVENNVKAMALGEAFFGSGRQASSLVFVYARAGVGSGIVINKRLLHGVDMGAGEIGHMILLSEHGKQCFCGQTGCLETLVSEPALMEQAAAAAQQHPSGLLAAALQTPSSSQNTPPINRLFDAARQGDPQAVQILEQAARFLGVALANLVNLLNPQMIVLGGLLVNGADLLLEPTRTALGHYAFADLGEKVDLHTSSFGWQAGLAGAAALVLTSQFYLNPEQI